MVSTSTPQSTIRLSDYKAYPFRIPSINLNVVVQHDEVLVTAGQPEPSSADDQEEELIDEFQDFLETVNPDDFLA